MFVGSYITPQARRQREKQTFVGSCIAPAITLQREKTKLSSADNSEENKFSSSVVSHPQLLRRGARDNIPKVLGGEAELRVVGLYGGHAHVQRVRLLVGWRQVAHALVHARVRTHEADVLQMEHATAGWLNTGGSTVGAMEAHGSPLEPI